jgi:AraC-like DNA-binding protein/catechol 2,3-dioxygenase-like lactoylglutathione lyase family enzyme
VSNSQDPALLRRLLRAKDRMDAASHEAWPVQRLAEVSGVSDAHFARSFAQAFGIPPHRYLLTRRIEQASTLLRDTELPITEIAFATGWESLGTFGRTFRDVTGQSRRGSTRPGTRLRPEGRATAGPHHRSFGEAPPRGRRYKRAINQGDSMSQGIQVVGLYVNDQDEALAFYVDKLGFRVHTDVRNGAYRWLTVQHPEQPSFQLGLFTPGPPTHDEATAQTLRAMVAKGAMPPLVLNVGNCRAVYEQWRAKGVEFTQEPVERYGQVDAGFRDPAGNGWKMIQAPVK